MQLELDLLRIEPQKCCPSALRVWGKVFAFPHNCKAPRALYLKAHRLMLSTTAGSTDETALMVMVGTNCGVNPVVLGAFVQLGHRSIVSLSGLHAEFCIEAPSQAAVTAVIGVVASTYSITVDPALAQSLRIFGGVLHAMLPAARQRMAEAAMGTVPGLAPVAVPAATQDNKDDDTGHMKVAMRQWKMQKLAANREHTKPRSNQISDKHVFKWHNDAFNHGRLVHFPGVMSVTDAAHAKPDATRTLGNGMKITIDSESDLPADERSLVANCLSQALLYLEALPAIFDSVMIEIGNAMGSWEMVPDDAARFVCQQASMWTALGAGAKEPKRKGDPAGINAKTDGPTVGGKEQRPALKDGRCHAFDLAGTCPKGNMCPYRSNHNKLKPKVAFQRDNRGGDRNRNRDYDRDRERDYYDRPRSDDRRSGDWDRGGRRN